MLAKKYDGIDVTGWYLSEKLDGVRAFWKNRKLYTRNGNIINVPHWYTKDFPDVEMDGELWKNRNSFNELSGIIRKKIPINSEWKKVKYVIFDLPGVNKVYEDRVKIYIKLTKKINCGWLKCLKVQKLKRQSELFEKLKKIEKKGGEGVMLRKPGSLYEYKRSSSLLKVKSFFDEEGVVIGYNEGTGKYKGMIGSLIIKGHNKKIFNVGSGLSDKNRKDPPITGSIITYKYFEKNNGIPRFPTYVGIRSDTFFK